MDNWSPFSQIETVGSCSRCTARAECLNAPLQACHLYNTIVERASRKSVCVTKGMTKCLLPIFQHRNAQSNGCNGLKVLTKRIQFSMRIFASWASTNTLPSRFQVPRDRSKHKSLISQKAQTDSSPIF